MLALILSRRDFREHDQVISAYTNNAGKVELLARGVKKITSKNSSHLEPFFLVNLEWAEGKEIKHLTKVMPEHSFPNLLQDFTALTLVKKSFQLVDRLVAWNEKDERLFALLLSWLEYLNQNKPHPFIYDIFSLKLWQVLGYEPQLNHCLHCDNEGVFFSSRSGGLLCSNCHHREIEAIPFSGTAVKIFQKLTQTIFEESLVWLESETFSKEVRSALQQFLQYHYPGKQQLKSA